MPTLILKSIWGKQPTVVLQYHNVNGQFSLCGGLKISTLPIFLKSLTSLFVSFVSLWNYDGCTNVITHLVTISKRTTVAEVKWFTMQPAVSKMLSFQETANVNHRILITHQTNLPVRRLPFTARTQTGLSLTLRGISWCWMTKHFVSRRVSKTKSSEITNVALSTNKEFLISRHHGARGDQNLALFWVLRLLTWHRMCYRKDVTFKCDVIKRGWTLIWFEISFLTVELHIDITQWTFKSIQEKQTSVNFINSDLMWRYSLWTTAFSGFNNASWVTLVTALKHFQGQGRPKDSDSANILTSVLILCWISVETMTKWLLSNGSHQRNHMKNTNCCDWYELWYKKRDNIYNI